MSIFEAHGGIILSPFRSYTQPFTNAMRNWEHSVLPSVTVNEDDIKLAENIIKSKLRVIGRVWSIGIMITPISNGKSEINYDAHYNVNLYLRVGKKNESEPFSTLEGYDLIFSEIFDSEDTVKYTTSLIFNFPPEYQKYKCLLRQIEGTPLKLKEWYDRISQVEFW